MKYNLIQIMRLAWSLRREKGYTMATALRLAWREAKGTKGYAFKLESVRAQITTYLVKLMDRIADMLKSSQCMSMTCCQTYGNRRVPAAKKREIAAIPSTVHRNGLFCPS